MKDLLKWWRAAVAQLDAMPARERMALLAAGIALLVGVEFMVVLPMQTQRRVAHEAAIAAVAEAKQRKAAQLDAQARQEADLDQRLKVANEALQALGVSSGVVGTRGESLSFLLSRTLRDSPLQVLSLRATQAEPMSLTADAMAGSVDPREARPPGTAAPLMLYRHRYVLALKGDFAAVTAALAPLEAALKPLRIERLALQGQPDGRVLATLHWVTIGLEKSWLSL